MNITTPRGVKETVDLKKGFGKYIFKASAESYAAITCNSVMITWVSQLKGDPKTCQAKGKHTLISDSHPSYCKKEMAFTSI